MRLQPLLRNMYTPRHLVLSRSRPAQFTQKLVPQVLSSDCAPQIESPLSGSQYPHIHVAGGSDPNFIYLGGNLDCPAHDAAATQYFNTSAFAYTENLTDPIYDIMCSVFLADIIPEETWDYYNAYAIWDYLNYQNVHNESVAAEMAGVSFTDIDVNISYVTELGWMADEQQYAFLGNMSAVNQYSAAPESATVGSISTIAGSTLAAKVLYQLVTAIETGGEYYKLSVLFSDHSPFVSFFALASLPDLNTDFYGLPEFGSTLAFELFSYTNASSSSSSSSTAFPDESDLWVRFSFRNGTVDNPDPNNNPHMFQAYPLFRRGPSETDMRWSEFVSLMQKVAIADTGDWCRQCGATNVFCAAWNSTNAVDSASGKGGSSSEGNTRGLSNAAAGAVGAIVALALVGLGLAAAMIIGGIRFRRVDRELRRRKSDLGGFKGSQKLASDRDLSVPKGGAVIGATVERKGSNGDGGPGSPVPGGMERVGSWELKDAEAGGFGSLNAGKEDVDAAGMRRESFEDGNYGMDPFADPVKAHERV